MALKAMRNERDVKENIKTVLKAIGAWWFMYVPSGFGASGIPDFICCYKGVFFTIEAKYGANKPTALQNAQMDKIADAGGAVFVIDEHNVHDLSIMVTKTCS